MDKWIDRWKYQIDAHQRQYERMQVLADMLLDKVDDIEREQYAVMGKIREIERKIENRKQKESEK